MVFLTSFSSFLLLIACSYLMPTSKAAAASLNDARLAWGRKSPSARQNIGWIRFQLFLVVSELHSHFD